MNENRTNWYFGDFRNKILIKPATFDFEARTEASEIAAVDSMGVVMLVWSSWTEYYKDASIPVGKIKVYEAKRYDDTPTYSGVLDADEYYRPFIFEEDR